MSAITDPDRTLDTVDGQEWFVFQRERFEVERRGRFWQIVAHYQVLGEEKARDLGRPYRFRWAACRRIAVLARAPGYHPIIGPVDRATAVRAIRP